MDLASSPAVSPRAPPSDRERAELIHGLYRNVPVGVAGAMFGCVVLCWMLLYIAPDRLPEVSAWLVFTVLSAAWQIILWAWYRRRPRPDDAWRPWARRFVIASLIEGVRWGVGSLFLAAPGETEQQVWVTMVVACAASSSVSSLGSYTPAFYALLIPAMGPFAIYGPLQPDLRYGAMALLDAIMCSTIAWLGWQQSRSLQDALRLRFENLDLAHSLRQQKELAEQANLAKSQFLAAASHDLRQPIHALGLFVGALGRRPMDADDARLTRQISETVEAMTGLFDSLLDVSQLDAGVVRPELQTLALQPLLERICREQGEELAGVPVRLTLVATSVRVRSDPVLLERMIRNVLSNAARHTRAGRVLVGVRRRGDRVSVEVWDTGPGIPAAHQEEIFQEYFQLGNPERDRTKGLGLGLAITRRLAHLLEHPITLTSHPGRGTAFRISAPIARGQLTASDVEASGAPPLRPGLVFLVDDELAVRQGAEELLGAWGFDVVAAGSGDELMARADPARRPDVLICDWRLRGDETAVAVVERVKAVFGPDVPVLLITGDTAPARLQDADRTGLALLHKPVAPGKLRAAIGNLTRKVSAREGA